VYYAYLCIYNLAVDMQLPIKWLKHIRVSDIDLLHQSCIPQAISFGKDMLLALLS